METKSNEKVVKINRNRIFHEGDEMLDYLKPIVIEEFGTISIRERELIKFVLGLYKDKITEY